MFENSYFSFNQDDFFRSFSVLVPSARQELGHYMNYLLMKQRQDEVVQNLFQDAQICAFVDALSFTGCPLEKISQQLLQLKQRYYELLNAVYEKYEPLLFATETFSLAKDFGSIAFENIEQALLSGDADQIAFEVNELQQGFHQLTAHHDEKCER